MVDALKQASRASREETLKVNHASGEIEGTVASKRLNEQDPEKFLKLLARGFL